MHKNEFPIDTGTLDYNKKESFDFLKKLLGKDSSNFKNNVIDILVCFKAFNKSPENFVHGFIELAVKEMVPKIKGVGGHYPLASLIREIKKYYDLTDQELITIFKSIEGHTFDKEVLKRLVF